MSAIVTLKKGEGRTIKAGGMWVFDNEIDTVTGTFENGEVVLVHDFDGYPMGRGFINVNSKIHVRMLTRKIDQEIDRAFLQMRVQNAWDYRKTTVDTSSCRVIFGESGAWNGAVQGDDRGTFKGDTCAGRDLHSWRLREKRCERAHEGRLAEGKGIYRSRV